MLLDFIIDFYHALLSLSYAMAPYILFGLIFAGIINELIPSNFITKHLGHDNFFAVIKATLFGMPLPVCSCGVIPLASSIKKSGASNGATLSFLISTPITGVDSILATYGMFGWAFTLYRVFTSMIIAIIAGLVTNIFSTSSQKVLVQEESESVSCCASQTCSTQQEIQNERKTFSIRASLYYAFVTLLSDIASPLLIGLLLGALITIMIPQNLSHILLEYSWLSYVIAIAIAVPMYVCATASLPIAAGLMLAGVSPGAAFVFLTAGPATNTVTIGVVKKMLGSTTLYVYLGTIIIGSLLFGFGLDYILEGININEMIHMHEDVGIIEVFSSILLWGFILYFVFKPYFHKKDAKENSCCSDTTCHK